MQRRERKREKSISLVPQVLRCQDNAPEKEREEREEKREVNIVGFRNLVGSQDSRP